jgi:hypothetical protein
MVLRAGFKKKLCVYIELMIYDKYRRKNTGPQCVKVSVIEPSDVPNTGMSEQMRDLSLRFHASLHLQLALWLVGRLVGRRPVFELQCCCGCKSLCNT